MKKIIFSVGLLVLTCLIVSPLIHEAVHVLALDSMNGQYILSLSDLPSVHASLKVLSPMNTFSYILILSTGILASLIIGSLLIIRGRKKMCHLSSMSGIGFLLNPSLAMFSKNDLSTMLSFFGWEPLSLFAGLALLGLCLYEANFVTKLLSGPEAYLEDNPKIQVL